MQSIANPDLSPRLRLAITRTARRLRQEADAGLSPSLTAALATVERHGPLTPRLLATLEKDGLVERLADPDDGRVSHVLVTKEGRALVKKLRSRKNAYLSKRLRHLDDEELETLERATAILERILEGPE
jgi:DNA-binding MarR family transcriptional regulator